MRKRLPWIITLILIIAAGGTWYAFRHKSTGKVTYTTGTVTKGTLVISVSSSGTTTSANRIPVTTTVTGTVSKVYVKDGDSVKVGQTLMVVTLDADGQAALAKAKTALLQAQSAVTSAQQGVQSLKSDITNAQSGVVSAQQQKVQLHQALLQAQSAYDTATATYDAAVSDDPNLAQKKLAMQSAKDALTVAQSRYDNADAAITQAKSQVTAAQQKSTSSGQSVTLAQASLTTAQQAYAQASGTIVASVAGTIADLTYVQGMTIVASSSSGSAAGSSSLTKIASIVTGTLPTASFSLAEADAPKVLPGQKATLTFDSIADKTFTGTVVGIDRTGSVSSGVTTYPMTIQLDATNDQILPNMSVTAQVITKTEDSVLLVPNAAVKTGVSGTSTVQVMQNGTPSSVNVEIGDASDSETVITSGLTEGQTVVTATITPSSTNSSSSSSGTSLFSGSTLRGGSSGTIRASGGAATFSGGGPPN